MDRDLVYRLSVANVSQALRDLGTVSDAVKRLAQQETQLANTAATAKVRASKTAADAQAKEAEKAAAAQVRASRKAEREAASAEKAKTRAAEKEARERARLEDRVLKDIDRQIKQSVREYEKSEREKTRIADREAKARARAEAAAAGGAGGGGGGGRTIPGYPGGVPPYGPRYGAWLRQRDKAFDRKRFYRAVAGAGVEGAYGALTTVGHFGMRAVSSVAAGAGLSDTFDVGGILQQRLMTQQRLRYISQESGGIDEASAYQKIRSAALRGQTQTSIASALDVASEKGKAGSALANIDQIAKEATAYNARIEDIATLRAQAQISSEQAGHEMSESELRLMVAKIGALGKRGTFRIGEIAKRSPDLFSRWVASGQSLSGGGLDELIGFSEIARSATGTSARATTAIKQVQDAVYKNEAKFRARGIQTRDSKGNQLDPLDVVMHAIAKTGGRPEGLVGKGGLFDVRAMSALNPLIAAQMGKKTEAERMTAMRDLLKHASSTAGITSASTDKDYAGAMDTTQKRLEQAKEQIRQTLEDALVPLFEKVAKQLPAAIEVLQQWIPKVGPFIERLGSDIKAVFETLAPVLKPAVGAALGFTERHPLAGIALGGAMRGAAKPFATGALRFLADSMVNTVPGLGGKFARGAVGAVAGAVSSAGATPVYIVGVSPGVSLGGGGGGFGGFGGAGGGLPGMGGAGTGALAGGAVAAFATAALVSAYFLSKTDATGSLDRLNNRRTASQAEMQEVADLRARQQGDREDMLAMLSGKEDPREVKRKRELAFKAYPQLSEAVESGKIAPEIAMAEIVKRQEASKGKVAFKVGPDGTLQGGYQGGPDAKENAALKEAFISIAKNAKEAAQNLSDLAAKANSAGNATSKIKNPPLPGTGGT